MNWYLKRSADLSVCAPNPFFSLLCRHGSLFQSIQHFLRKSTRCRTSFRRVWLRTRKDNHLHGMP